MRDYISEEKLFSALASSVRLKILDSISNGFANPGEIAGKLNRHRSSIEKHLHILVIAGIIEKEPSLNKKGQLSVKYRIKVDLSELLSFADRTFKVQKEE
ncbi:MAG: helix-turn-helix domain-containing protein [Candidatus Thermoplasmatota archaeon]|jgi:predicted transcriptional regulator|nr:helix-turn-helix domain-containing protein [Candidatus Thermoplasmatota archaeon]MCL5733010.1 helix-turn-helix domain-containing protein [Candidatus Thermoplasmatota archaeon]WMT45195.1 MAG: helix-turn-helix domain-containing protein [Cuniculiplasma divulgatum]